MPRLRRHPRHRLPTGRRFQLTRAASRPKIRERDRPTLHYGRDIIPHQMRTALPIRHGRFAPGIRKSSGEAPYSPLFAPSALAAMGLRPSVRAPGWDYWRGQRACNGTSSGLMPEVMHGGERWIRSRKLVESVPADIARRVFADTHSHSRASSFQSRCTRFVSGAMRAVALP
jgi:hypothetical protein